MWRFWKRSLTFEDFKIAAWTCSVLQAGKVGLLFLNNAAKTCLYGLKISKDIEIGLVFQSGAFFHPRSNLRTICLSAFSGLLQTAPVTITWRIVPFKNRNYWTFCKLLKLAIFYFSGMWKLWNLPFLKRRTCATLRSFSVFIFLPHLHPLKCRIGTCVTTIWQWSFHLISITSQHWTALWIPSPNLSLLHQQLCWNPFLSKV